MRFFVYFWPILGFLWQDLGISENGTCNSLQTKTTRAAAPYIILPCIPSPQKNCRAKVICLPGIFASQTYQSTAFKTVRLLCVVWQSKHVHHCHPAMTCHH